MTATAVGDQKSFLQRAFEPLLDEDLGVTATLDVPYPVSIGIQSGGRVSVLAQPATGLEVLGLCSRHADDQESHSGVWREDHNLPFEGMMAGRQAFLKGLRVWISLPGRVFPRKVIIEFGKGVFARIVPAPDNMPNRVRRFTRDQFDEEHFNDLVSAALDH